MTVIVPPEWAPHRAMWLGFPSHAELWEDNLEPAQAAVAARARALAGPGHEKGRLLTGCDEGEAAARRLLGDVAGIDIVPGCFGDIWLRDTGPIFAKRGGADIALGFAFNGWGGKYALPGDDTLAGRIATLAGYTRFESPIVLEGGSVEYDGEGTVLTTRQCLLNPNRNSLLSEEAIENALHDALGTEKALWVTDGLLNDHTDGHIDTIARLIAPGVALCMEPSGASDPNREVLIAIRRELEAMVDARGRKLQVHVVPSPGLVEDEDGEVMPASHVNYLVTNDVVVVPLYETAFDDATLKAFEPLFPGRRVIGVQAKAILAGGGAFHCITQQVPSAVR